jgi:[protein-PII] uridylyltransferase
MWTEWKAELLRDLFYKTQGFLLGTPAADSRQAKGLKNDFVQRWTETVGAARALEVAESLPARYYESTSVWQASYHARLLTRARREPLAATLRHRRQAGFSQVCLAAGDRPGLLAILTGVLSAHRVNILSAAIVSTSEGLALDTFDVQAPHGRLLERKRWSAAKSDLLRVLTGQISLEEVLQKNKTGSLLQKHLPAVPTQISIDNRGSQNFTIVDVRAEDRMGLLYVIASTLHRLGVEIALARISTEAHRAIDSFYVSSRGAKVTDADQLNELLQALERAILAK